MNESRPTSRLWVELIESAGPRCKSANRPAPGIESELGLCARGPHNLRNGPFDRRAPDRPASVRRRHAQGDGRPDSDIDLLIDVNPEAVEDFYAFAGLKLYVANLFESPVDAASQRGLRAAVQERLPALLVMEEIELRRAERKP
jgi:hypothetical protein